MISQISGLRFPLPEARLLLHKKKALTDTCLPQYLTNSRAFKISRFVGLKSIISGFDKEQKNISIYILDITESFNACFENNADLGRLIYSFSQK